MLGDFHVPVEEINSRIARIQEKMRQTSLEAVLILQRVDLFYFSGTSQNAFLYIPDDGNPLLLVRKYFPRARDESGLKNMIEIKSVKEAPGRIKEFYGKLPKTLGLELDVMPLKEFRFYQSLFPRKEMRDCSSLVAELRTVKSSWEIAQMEKTAGLSSETFAYLQSVIRPKMNVLELGTLIQIFGRRHGHSGQLRVRNHRNEAYSWRIHAGRTPDSFPQCLPDNEPVLIELATVLNGYHISEARMIAPGAWSAEARDADQAVRRIHDAVLEKIKPGLQARAVYETALAEAKNLGDQDIFLGIPGKKSGLIGHGIGTELIEPPFLSADDDMLLQPGMILTLEPVLTLKNEFITGLIDVIQMTPTGASLLTKTRPH